MDSLVRQLLARVSMLLEQELDFRIDPARFEKDSEYAAQVLDLAHETGQGELTRLVRQIRSRQLELFELHARSVAPPDSDPQRARPSPTDQPEKRS